MRTYLLGVQALGVMGLSLILWLEQGVTRWLPITALIWGIILTSEIRAGLRYRETRATSRGGPGSSHALPA